MVNCIDKLIFAIKIFDVLSYNNFGNKIIKNLRIENDIVGFSYIIEEMY